MSSLGHSIWTVLVFIIFIGIVLWAFSGKRKKDFDEAAKLALDDDNPKTTPHKTEE
jgi:cytochrome c oxidase cbb3-type subunit IV